MLTPAELPSSARTSDTPWHGRWLGPAALIAVALTGFALSATVTLPTHGASQSQFVYSQLGRVSQAAVADFNCDNRVDVLLTNGLFGSANLLPVTVALADGTGGFIDGTTQIFTGPIPGTQHLGKILIDDFNGDGRPDAFIADSGIDGAPYTGQQNKLILSAAGCKLIDATANLPQQTDFTHSATTGDIDNDGDIDIYVGNIWGAFLIPAQIWRNDGTAHFSIASGLLPAAQTDLNLNRYTTSLLVDVNNDDHLDLALGGDNFGQQSAMLMNDGTGHFSAVANPFPAKPLAPDAVPLDVKTTDFDRDGFADLAMEFTKWTPYYEGRWIQMLRNNNGTGTFTDQSSTRVVPAQADNLLTWLLHIHFVDLDGDGNDDLVGQVIGINNDNHRFYPSNSSGVFTEQPFLAGNLGDVFAFVDARGDGHRDVLSTSNLGNDQHRVSLLSNTSAVVKPGIPQLVRPTHALVNHIRVWWPYVWGATIYEVWRSSSPGSLGSLVGTVSATAFDDATVSGTTAYYRVRALNSAGTSDYSPVTIGTQIVPTPPSISTHPASQTVPSGTQVSLSVVATGPGPFSYQWYIGSSGDTSTPATGDVLSTFKTTALITNATHWVRVTNVYGSADSNTATLTIAALGPELVANGNFSSGITGWSLYDGSDIVHNAGAGGVFKYHRADPTTQAGQAVIYRNTGAAVTAATSLAAQFDIGNEDSARKRISVLILDSDFTDLSVCTFWLPPNSPNKTYRMRTHPTKNWLNASIYFYVASTGSGNYVLDNVSLKSNPGFPTSRTECVDANAPLSSAVAAGPNLIGNGDFSSGLSAWGPFNDILFQVSGGVFEFTRPGTPGALAGGVLQTTPQTMTPGQILTSTFDLGNSSSVRKRVTVLLHALDFSDLSACTFWLAPFQPLSSYAIRASATKDWLNATVSFYGATTGPEQWTRLDNVTLKRTQGSLSLGTECFEPGSSPSSAAPDTWRDERHAVATASIGADSTPGRQGFSATDRGWQIDALRSVRSVLGWGDRIDLTDAKSATLTFDSSLTSRRSRASVEVSLDGRTWRSIADIASSDGFRVAAVDLSSFAGRSIYVRFAFDAVEPGPGTAPDIWRIENVMLHVSRPSAD